jgi:TonB family protein
MPYFSDSQEALSRFGDYIEEFQSVFRSNDVDYGTPDDFFAFARSLNYDAQLRADLSAQAKSVMARENKVPLRTVLTIIAVASGGPEVANSDRDMSKPVNLLIDFLIKAGGCIQINSGYPSPEQPNSPSLETADSPGHTLTLDRSSADEGMRAEQAEQIDIAPPTGEEAPGNPPVDRFPQDYAGSPNTLTESLTRLEINSLQLKHYLDSIDQRISRMEPRLDNVPSLAFSDPAPHPRDASDAKFSAAIPSETEPHPPHESTPRPTQPPSEANRRPELISRLWTSFQQLRFSRRPIVLPVILLFAALLLCALFLWSFGRSRSHPIVHPANVTGNDTTNAGSMELPPSAVPTASAPSASTSTLQPTTDSQGSTSSPGGTGNHPPKNSAAIPLSRAHTSSPAPTKEAPPPASAADGTTTSDTLGTADTAAPSSASLSGSLVNVSSGVMAANLLAAPMPTYPRLASLTHMQGNVMMQAIISKDGTVESVHVLKGHRLLRSAATNAVRAWRYRPYLVNGRPVEVATIVSVEFTLEH